MLAEDLNEGVAGCGAAPLDPGAGHPLLQAGQPSVRGGWLALPRSGGMLIPRSTDAALFSCAIDSLREPLRRSNNTASIYQNLFPPARFETAGAPGKNWVEAELRQTNNILLWILDGTVIAQRTNTSAFTSGNIMIGFMDPFTSIASPAEDAFVLFANLRVEDLSAPALQPPVDHLPAARPSRQRGRQRHVQRRRDRFGAPRLPMALQWHEPRRRHRLLAFLDQRSARRRRLL